MPPRILDRYGVNHTLLFRIISTQVTAPPNRRLFIQSSDAAAADSAQTTSGGLCRVTKKQPRNVDQDSRFITRCTGDGHLLWTSQNLLACGGHFLHDVQKAVPMQIHKICISQGTVVTLFRWTFLRDSVYQKSFQSVDLGLSYSKNTKWTFWRHSLYSFLLLNAIRIVTGLCTEVTAHSH